MSEDVLCRGVCVTTGCPSNGDDWDVWAVRRDGGLYMEAKDALCPDCEQPGRIEEKE